MIIFSRCLADCSKISKLESKLVHSIQVFTFPSSVSLHLLIFWLQTLVSIISIMPDIASNFWCTAIWSCCAVWLESEHRLFTQTLCPFRSAALPRIIGLDLEHVGLFLWWMFARLWWALLWKTTRSCLSFHTTLKKKSVVSDLSLPKN